jgi:hypothetical protein
VDCDADGVIDLCSIADEPGLDCNLDGLLDACQLAGGSLADCDADGVPDVCLLPDPVLDCDQDGVLDTCQLAADASLDCNANGILDVCDIQSAPTEDCDSDGVLDTCQLALDPALDCDADGQLDTCQIASFPGLDANANAVLDHCECPVTNYCSSLPNSTGLVASISYTGSPFIAVNDLSLVASDCPPLQFGVFYYGAAQLNQSFGDGIRCVGPGGAGLYRLPPTFIGANGVAVRALDYSYAPSPGGILAAGATWYFQFWYRDPAGGPVGFNLSDGLSVTFCP